MSDGPHRSLPMRPHWKRCAERAANVAFSMPEFGESLTISLWKDLSAPLAQIQAALVDGGQSKLFINGQALDSIRPPGSASAQALPMLDSARSAVERGLSGREALRFAAEAAIFGHTRSVLRSMEEHYLRCDQRAACNRLTKRFQSALAPDAVRNLATRLLEGKPPMMRLALRSIDDGPRL